MDYCTFGAVVSFEEAGWYVMNKSKLQSDPMLPCANASVKFLKAVFMWGVFSAPGHVHYQILRIFTPKVRNTLVFLLRLRPEQVQYTETAGLCSSEPLQIQTVE